MNPVFTNLKDGEESSINDVVRVIKQLPLTANSKSDPVLLNAKLLL